jgi:prepilin-type N-terminal cleavage/methylation domain-containing protein
MLNKVFSLFKKSAERREGSAISSHPCHLAAGGFTLLEILVSLALLSIALVTIFELFSANLKGIAASEDYVLASLKAESVMREILDDEELEESSWGDTTDDGYTMDVEITTTSEKRTENLQVELLEVSLTLHWEKGAKDRQLTLKTIKLVPKQI